jgi:DNA-directed RNA polymerase specialized sigma subunit
MDEYNQIILDAARTIEKIGDEKMRQVLSLRYLSGLRWEEISNKIGYTLRQTFRLHGRALAAAGRVLGIR